MRHPGRDTPTFLRSRGPAAVTVTLALALALAILGLLAPVALAQDGGPPRSSIPGAHFAPSPMAQRSLNLAESRLRRGEVDLALEALREAVELDSLSSEVFEKLGVTLAAAGRPREAYDALRRATLLNPGSAFAYNWAGQVLLTHLGRPQGAEAAFRQALRVHPGYGPAHFSLFVFRLARAELDSASAAIRAARRSAASESESMLFFGAEQQLIAVEGDYAEAEHGLRMHLSRVPSDLRAQQSRALVERVLGSTEEAQTTLSILRSDLRPQAAIYNETALVHRAAGQRDSAVAWFEMAWELDAASSEAGYNLALEQLAAGDTAEAWTWLARAERRDPGHYAVPWLAGTIHRARGDEERARRAFEHAFRRNPFSLLAAEALDREIAGLVPSSPADSGARAAERLLLAGDVAVSSHHALRAARDPEIRPWSLQQLSRGNRLAANAHGLRVAQLEAVLEVLSEKEKAARGVVHRELGHAHRALGNDDDARVHYERSLELIRKETDLLAPTLTGLVSLRAEAGEAEGAWELGERYRDAEDARFLEALAAVAAATGREEEARRLAERARARGFLPVEFATPSEQGS